MGSFLAALDKGGLKEGKEAWLDAWPVMIPQQRRHTSSANREESSRDSPTTNAIVQIGYYWRE